MLTRLSGVTECETVWGSRANGGLKWLVAPQHELFHEPVTDYDYVVNLSHLRENNQGSSSKISSIIYTFFSTGLLSFHYL